MKVITAGGAANPGNKSKKKSKKIPKDVEADDKTNADALLLPEMAEPTSSPSTEPQGSFQLELEDHTQSAETEDCLDSVLHPAEDDRAVRRKSVEPVEMHKLIEETPPAAESSSKSSELFWLFLCFLGIMASFVVYGVLLEYTTSGGRKLHELSFLFVTSSLYTITAAAGRYVRAETPTTIPPARFAILGLTSMGSTFCSVRSLRYVIYPIQVLAKSCKPVPVMLIGALMGKKYNMRKYINVAMIVSGVALFMGGGDSKKSSNDDHSASEQLFGIALLFVSLCFDGGTGAYEDKLMSVHSVQPFDLMYNIQLGKTILAGVSLLVLNQVHVFVQMCSDMGFLLVALGLSGALGQVFIFVTIAKFGALTCSIIGLARKITTLVFSIWYFGHHLNGFQTLGLVISVSAMILNFMGKKGGGGGGHGGGGGGHHHNNNNEPAPPKDELPEDMQQMLSDYHDDPEAAQEGDIELK